MVNKQFEQFVLFLTIIRFYGSIRDKVRKRFVKNNKRLLL